METQHRDGIWENEDQSHSQQGLHNSELENSEQRMSDDISEINEHKHHEHHGNKKYQSFSNHSSADDQPGTTTDTNLGRDHH